MKKLIFLSFMAFSGCTSIEVLEIQSFNSSYVNTGFQYSNDSVMVRYDFWNDGGMMYLTIYNNLDVPLFIDWKTSSFIYQDNGYMYWDDRIHSTSSNSSTSVYGRMLLTGIPAKITNGQTIITTQQEERITSIAPHASIIKAEFRLTAPGNKIDEGEFTETSSPMKFRNYLVFSTKEDFSSIFSVDNSFYVSKSKIVKKGDYEQYKKPSYFYVSHIIKEQKGTDGSGF